jgi:hypothetical protein
MYMSVRMRVLFVRLCLYWCACICGVCMYVCVCVDVYSYLHAKIYLCAEMRI